MHFHSTAARDSGILANHINPQLEHIKITGAQVQGLVNQWALVSSPTTVVRQSAVLIAVFRYAEDHALIQRSPCKHLNMPKAQPTERHLITPDETKAIAEAVGTKLSPSIYIAAVLGLRWGELHALRVNRLDLDAGYLTVTATITRGPQGEPVEGEPKSRRGNRTQSIPPRLVQILTEHITAQELGSDDLLFPTVRVASCATRTCIVESGSQPSSQPVSGTSSPLSASTISAASPRPSLCR